MPPHKANTRLPVIEISDSSSSSEEVNTILQASSPRAPTPALPVVMISSSSEESEDEDVVTDGLNVPDVTNSAKPLRQSTSDIVISSDEDSGEEGGDERGEEGADNEGSGTDGSSSSSSSPSGEKIDAVPSQNASSGRRRSLRAGKKTKRDGYVSWDDTVSRDIKAEAKKRRRSEGGQRLHKDGTPKYSAEARKRLKFLQVSPNDRIADWNPNIPTFIDKGVRYSDDEWEEESSWGLHF
ncbi:hypothetical protein VNI00_004664 [Paramarasmius palmivorus]|uniref:Uncharacterized protein n=1 Tax=Paramarasmius palmivorus TaxID=297713 RepID=A0AAW0DKB8_9AGAR